MSELKIYTKCLTCTFRELKTSTHYRSVKGLDGDIVSDSVRVESCIHEPMCRWISLEKPISVNEVE